MTSNRQNPSVIVIGAGMTGICLVIKLREAGITNITLLEKADSVGGTWRENRYPGVACDVPSHAYTYAFEPNPNWSSFFASGAEIAEYYRRVYYKYGVNYCTHFGEAVTACQYQNERWTVTTAKGNTYEADLLFSATGILHQPKYPDILGLQDFAGTTVHSARWDKNIDLQGKKIGVIGTGSSAAQLIPELINSPGTDVTVFQRTAQWLVEAKNKPYSDKQQQQFREQPWRMALVRALSLWTFAQGTSALTSDNWWGQQMHKLFAWNARRYLEQSIQDPTLRAKLTPDYKFGCKRVVMNETFYPAIQKPNAHLVTDAIERIEPRGVVTKNGKLHDIDLLVLATGFDPTAFMRPMTFTGRDGLSIEQAWQTKVTAYRSLLIPGFPNFFLMLGPNSPIGNYSVIAMSEVQADYCIKLIKLWQAGTLQHIEATPTAVQQWMAMLKSNMTHTVWASGCQSWYLDADGDPLTWPDKWSHWVTLMRDVNTADLVR